MEEENDQEEQRNRSPLRMVATFFLVIMVPLSIGKCLTQKLIPNPKVGIIRRNYDIFGQTAFEFAEQVAIARGIGHLDFPFAGIEQA